MLQQRDGALRLGVHAASVRNWESGRTEPALDLFRGVIEFLGYDPRPEAQTFGERLRRHRQGLGISQSSLAERLGVDPSTLARWENGLRLPNGRQLALVEVAVQRGAEAP